MVVQAAREWRKWRCPECGRIGKIRAGAEPPDMCPECDEQERRGERQKTTLLVAAAVAVAALMLILVVAALSLPSAPPQGVQPAAGNQPPFVERRQPETAPVVEAAVAVPKPEPTLEEKEKIAKDLTAAWAAVSFDKEFTELSKRLPTLAPDEFAEMAKITARQQEIVNEYTERVCKKHGCTAEEAIRWHMEWLQQ